MKFTNKKVHKYLRKELSTIENATTLQEIFINTMKRNEKEVACIYTNEKGKLKSYKYSQFKKNTYALASALGQYLEKRPKNKPVILKLSNNPHWGETFYAILMCGFKPVLVNAKDSKEGTQNLINQSGAVAIVSDDAHEYSVIKITLEELFNTRTSYTFEPKWENEVYFCSSGTTGDVKLMVFNGKNIVAQLLAASDLGKETKYLMYPKKMGEIKILAMLPFHHVFGFVAVFLWFSFFGKTLVYPASLAPTDLLSICQKVGITHVFAVPLLWDSIAQSLGRKVEMQSPAKQEIINKMIGYNTGKLNKQQAGQGAWDVVRKKIQKSVLGCEVKYCISGGGYLADKTSTIINGIGYPLYNGFGMTEVGVTSVDLNEDVNIRLRNSIGHAMHGVEYKIAPQDPSNPTRGELLIKSDIVHVREIIAGVEGPTKLNEEGYFQTGDIAEVDSNNCYYIKGRIKDIIINADGENIFPDELELYFKKIPNITHLCVLGVKKENSQDEKIVLVIEIDRKTSDEQFEEIKKAIQENAKDLPKGARIDDVLLSKDKLPLANSLKVKRFAIKKEIEKGSTSYQSINAKRVVKTIKGFSKEEIEQIRDPMLDIFSKVLFLPKIKIEDNGHWINDLGGDSMSYVELITEVEAKFNVKIPETLYGKLENLNDFVEEILILKKEEKK